MLFRPRLMQDGLYTHFADAANWYRHWHWLNFSPAEISCRHCGEFYLDANAMDSLQMARDLLNKPMRINSAHRCAIHNAHVGGAPLSQHKKIAFDISLHGHDRGDLLTACQDAGFTSFGFYQSFLHVDTRARPTFWYSSNRARDVWLPITTGGNHASEPGNRDPGKKGQ